MLESDNMLIIAAAIVLVVFAVSSGQCAMHDKEQNVRFGIECVKAGNQMINLQCVKSGSN